MNSKALSADDILGADDLTIESVDVPEWGGTVHVRALSGAEREKYARSVEEYHAKGQMQALLVAMATCNAQGDRVFTDDRVELLSRKSARAIGRLADVASRLSGLGAAAAEDAKKPSPALPESGADSSGG